MISEYHRPVLRPVIGLRTGYLSSTPHLYGKSPSGRWLSAPRESHPSEDLSELPPLVATDHGRNRFNARLYGRTGVPIP